jgi:hypothetical protein
MTVLFNKTQLSENENFQLFPTDLHFINVNLQTIFDVQFLETFTIHLHTIRRSSRFKGSLVMKQKLSTDFMQDAILVALHRVIMQTVFIIRHCASVAYALYQFRPTLFSKHARSAAILKPRKSCTFF